MAWAWQKEGQHHSHTVDHESDEVAWRRNHGSVTHKLLVMGGDAMRLRNRTNSSVTCILLVIGSDAG